jgi:hypothetical protein
VIQLSELVGLLNDIPSVEIEIVDAPGRTMFATRELIQSLIARQGEIIG